MTIKDDIAFLKKKLANPTQDFKSYKSILDKLLKLEEEDQPDPMHNAMVGIYKEFLADHNIPMVKDARQFKALKEIIKSLRSLPTIGQDDEQIIAAWQFIFAKWDRVGTFIGKQKHLIDINRNLQEILDKIRNGSDKKSDAHNKNQHLRDKTRQRRNRSGNS